MFCLYIALPSFWNNASSVHIKSIEMEKCKYKYGGGNPFCLNKLKEDKEILEINVHNMEVSLMLKITQTICHLHTCAIQNTGRDKEPFFGNAFYKNKIVPFQTVETKEILYLASSSVFMRTCHLQWAR